MIIINNDDNPLYEGNSYSKYKSKHLTRSIAHSPQLLSMYMCMYICINIYIYIYIHIYEVYIHIHIYINTSLEV
jgi:hypothetical protein